MDKAEIRADLGLKELIAIGVGGMIGGGIFSVMGLAVGVTGNAAPLAFLLGGLLALLSGYSFVKLALTFRSDGASFTYLEYAWPGHLNVAAITGWLLVIGYIGTTALYAFTFGAYGGELLGAPGAPLLRQFLSVGVIGVFMVVNLQGARASGTAEDLVVYSKIVLLGLLAMAGLGSVRAEHLTPVMDHGLASVFMAAALVFVAYEGFELITNGVRETRRPERNIPRGIYGSIVIVSLIYIALAIVGIGSLDNETLVAAREYALAVAAEPALGQAGRVLVSIAALLATASAVNATMFGSSRLMAEMASERDLPQAFSFRNRGQVPWLAVVCLSLFAALLSYLGGLELIASFSSMTFLLVSLAVSIANLKLHRRTGSSAPLILLTLVLLLATIATLVIYLWRQDRASLYWMLGIYLLTVLAETLFIRRRPHPPRSPY